MTGQNKNKKVGSKGWFSTVVKLLSGAVIGAGAVVAGEAALKDKKNRDKLQQGVTAVKDKAAGYIKIIQKGAKEKWDNVEKNLSEGKEKVKVEKGQK